MKLGGWIVMITVMVLFLSLIGIDTGLSSILSSVGINVGATSTTADLENSSFWIYVLAILAASTGATLIIGFFGNYDVSIAILPTIVFVAGIFGKTFWSIMSLQSLNMWWLQSIVVLVFTGLGLGFIFACYDYFSGR